MSRETDKRNCAFCAIEITPAEPPSWIQLLPFGRVNNPAFDFEITPETAASILGFFNAHSADLVIDWEHASMFSDQAPAAGWIKDLDDRGPEGIWGRVEWNQAAADQIRAREYRYLSPVVVCDKEDAETNKMWPLVLHSVALTNTPLLRDMEPLANKFQHEEENEMSEASKKSIGSGPETDAGTTAGAPDLSAERQSVALNSVRAALGLRDDAEASEITDAVTANVAVCAEYSEIKKMLDLDVAVNKTVVVAKVGALTNPGAVAPAADLAAMTARVNELETQRVWDDAVAAGKIAPANTDWFGRMRGLNSPADFTALCKDAPVIIPVDQVVAAGSERSGAKPTALTAEDAAVCKALDIDENDFIKHNKEAIL